MASERALIDAEKDKADYEAANKILEDASDRVRWILYQTLFNSGLRVDRAAHEIAKLAPRKVL